MNQNSVFSRVYSRNTANVEKRTNGEAATWRALFGNSRIHVLGTPLIRKMKVVPKSRFLVSYRIEKIKRIYEYSNNRWY